MSTLKIHMTNLVGTVLFSKAVSRLANLANFSNFTNDKARISGRALSLVALAREEDVIRF